MRRSLALGLVLALGFLAGQVFSKDEPRGPSDEVLKQLEQYGTPGPEHSNLKRLAGNYEVRFKATMDPSEPMREAVGRAEDKPIMGGLFLKEEYEGTCPFTGKPVKGVSYLGFDNAKKKYQMCWLDSLASGITLTEGTADAAGKVITFHGLVTDRITGKEKKVRQVITTIDEKTSKFEEFMQDKDGREFRAIEATYIRK